MRDKWIFLCISAAFIVIASVFAQSPQQPQNAPPKKPSSYLPVVDTETFAATHDRMSAAKSAVMKRQMDLLAERYDLSTGRFQVGPSRLDRPKDTPTSGSPGHGQTTAQLSF